MGTRKANLLHKVSKEQATFQQSRSLCSSSLEKENHKACPHVLPPFAVPIHRECLFDQLILVSILFKLSTKLEVILALYGRTEDRVYHP
jgi:hypothetical protein